MVIFNAGARGSGASAGSMQGMKRPARREESAQLASCGRSVIEGELAGAADQALAAAVVGSRAACC